MLFRLAVAGVLCSSGAVSQDIDEDSFVEEAEDEEVEDEEVESADDDAALEGDEEGKPVKKLVKAVKAAMGNGSNASAMLEDEDEEAEDEEAEDVDEEE